MLVSIPSNRPARLQKTLLKVLERLHEDNVRAEVLVVDGSKELEKNRLFAKHAAKSYRIPIKVVSEFEYQRAFPDFSHLFKGPYGGPRNVALAHGVQRGQDVVFLDDDVVPLEGFFSRFGAHLSSHAIVAGAYAGRRTGAAFLMDKAHRALEDYSKGRASFEDALSRIKEAFCGWSDDWAPSVEGFRGGCLGVSLKTASRYCFFPTTYRVEDGLYCELSRFFTGEEPFKPFLDEAPVGFHKPERGDIFTLSRYYRNTLQGSSLGLSIQYLLQHFGRNFAPSALDLACKKGPESLLSEFEPEKTALRREQQKIYDDTVGLLGDKQVKKAYLEFVNLKKEDAAPPNLSRQVERFFQVQSDWKRFLSFLKDSSDLV